MRKLYKRMRPLLGTFVEVGTFDDVPGFEAAVADALTAIETVHNTLGFHNPDSELSQLNSANGQELTLSPLTIVALRIARAMTAASDGLFNCTVGGALVEQGKLPRHRDASFRTSGSAQDLHIQGRRARLLRPVLITLDGIAKGYAVDLAVHAMKSQGAISGWVNAGGDLRVFGELVLPLQRREADESLTDLGQFQEIAVASSLVSEQYTPQYPGQIIGPNQATPQIGVWTVSAPSAWLADALTKVASLSPESQREDLIKRLGGKLIIPQRSDLL